MIRHSPGAVAHIAKPPVPRARAARAAPRLPGALMGAAQ